MTKQKKNFCGVEYYYYEQWGCCQKSYTDVSAIEIVIVFAVTQNVRFLFLHSFDEVNALELCSVYQTRDNFTHI